MQIIFLVLLGLILQSCALFPTEKLERSEFLTQSYQGDASAEEIRDSLTKSEKTGGGFIAAQVMPLSEAYLSARRFARASSRGLSPEALAVMKADDYNRFLREKNCFQVDAQIIRHHEAMDLSKWEVYFVDDEKVSHVMVWQSFAHVIQGRFASSHGELPKWVVSGVACTQDVHPLDLGFSVRLTPAFVPWPFPKTLVFDWIFVGNEQERKEKRRTFRRYRGY